MPTPPYPGHHLATLVSVLRPSPLLRFRWPWDKGGKELSSMYSRGKLIINFEDLVLTLLDKGIALSRTGFSHMKYKRPECLPLRPWIKPRSRLPAGLSELLQYQLPGFWGA